jgi:hypothetical protein
MKLFKDVIGHSKQIEYLRSLVANRESIPHAFVFEGLEHVGRATLIEAFCNELLQGKGYVDLQKKTAHAFLDSYFLDIPEDKKEIPIDNVRDFMSTLQYSPLSGGYKFGVIFNAQTLNDFSCNALLKLLEEPPKNTLLFLITTDSKLLSETILSRCVKISLSLVSHKELLNAFPKAQQEVIAVSQGKPGIAVELLQNPEKFGILREQVTACMKLLTQPKYLASEGIKQLLADVSLIEIMENITHDMIMLSQGVETVMYSFLLPEYLKFLKTHEVKSLIALGNGLREYTKAQEYNVNQQLFIESLIFSL